MAGTAWPDLSAFVERTPARRKAKGLIVTVRGVEWYEPPKVVRNRSGKVTEVTVKVSEGKRTFALVDRAVSSVRSVRKGREPKVIRDEEQGQDVYVSLAPAIVATATLEGTRVSAADYTPGVRQESTPIEKGSRPVSSYAQRRAAVVASRGW